MTTATLYFNQLMPDLDAARLSESYQAALDMAAWADDQPITAVTISEHHGTDNGWLPAPLVFAGMILGRTKRVMVNISALLVPMHDPVRLAEDIAVLDLAAPGRLSIVTGLGYRPSEYALLDKEWKRRGKLLDEALEVMQKAWSGEQFEYRGETVRITPHPTGSPMIFVGGSGPKAAERAARFGLGFFPAAHLPELEALYYEKLAEHGKEGFAMLPPQDTSFDFVAEDVDAGWDAVGENLLHEASCYRSWQTPDIRSAVHSAATTVEELREEGIYRVLTPDLVRDEIAAKGASASFVLHPLCAGISPELGWNCLNLFAEGLAG